MIDQKVMIEHGTTAIRILCNNGGRIAEWPSVSIYPFLRGTLTEYDYDYRLKHSYAKYYYFKYNKENGTLYMPVHILPYLITYFKGNGVKYDIDILPPNPSADITLVNSGLFEDRDYQKDAIDYLTNNDNHMRVLELQTGCLAGDTVINFNRAKNGFSSTIHNAYERFNNTETRHGRSWCKNIPTFVRSFTGDRIHLHEVEDIVYSGIKDVYCITLENGIQLKCTIDHKIMTKFGFVKAERIVGKSVMCDSLHAKSSGKVWKKIIDNYIVISKNHPYAKQYQNRDWNCYRIMRHRAMYEAHHLNNMTIIEFVNALKDIDHVKTMKFIDPSIYDIHHKDGNHENDRPSNLECLLRKDHQKFHGAENDVYKCFNQGIPEYSNAVLIEYIGKEPTYDIICKDPHHNFVANGIVVHNSGKSYIAARAIMEIGKRSLISVPASLVSQWYDALCSMCESKIGIIRGSDTVYNLINENYETDIDIFLASVTTLQGYASGIDIYGEAPPLRDFLRNLLIGTKVVDEFHINFAANVMVDIQSDVENNIYLSATGLRSSKNSQAIFRKVYPDSIRYDGVKYDKYVNITECRYSLGAIDEKKVVTERGYSQYKYEKHIMRGSTRLYLFINKVLHPTLEMFFINKAKFGQKVLILVGLKDFAETLTAWCRDTYPALTSIAFLHGVGDEELEKSDIIVSTIGSAGTGRDIKGLRTVILFSSFGSEALTLQTIGRLRKMEDTPEFVYLLNTKIKSHHQHCKKRRDIYKDIGKSFQVVEID